MPILELTDVTKTFHTKSFWGKTKEVHAVNGVTFSIDKGETLGLVGGVGLRQKYAREPHHPS